MRNKAIALFSTLIMVGVLVSVAHNFKNKALSGGIGVNHQSVSASKIFRSPQKFPYIGTNEIFQQIHFLIINYTSFGSRLGLITINPKDAKRIVFSPMVNAKGDYHATGYPKAIATGPELTKAIATGPELTNAFALISNGETAFGSYGAGAGMHWCLVIQDSGYYAKVTNMGGGSAVSNVKPRCEGGQSLRCCHILRRSD